MSVLLWTPMLIEVYRMNFGANSTTGLLSIDSLNQFTTLEPAQSSGMLMPAGTYKVCKTMSPRMGYISPELQDVPGHIGERIHVGNYPHDTHGCILIGETRAPDFIGNSQAAFDEFMAITPEEFLITINDPPEAT